MEESRDALVETREELMVSPTGSNPTLREARFIKPSVTSIKGPVFQVPLHYFSSLPPSSFEPRKWPLKVNFSAWRFPQEKWKTWVEKMASLHESTWREAGIFDPIINSTYRIERNNDLVLGLGEKWCPETNSFIFPWGEATITLEDVMIAGGYSVMGSPVFISVETVELKEIEEKLYSARRELHKTTYKKAAHFPWMVKFMNSGSDIEHEAFLAMWLSRYVFASSRDVIVPSVFSIAVYLARGTKIALAPSILATIYRDLSLLKSAIMDSTKLGTNGNEDAVVDVTLCSQFQLVQIWAWERFMELQPKPNLIGNGEPRLAQWNKVMRKADNVKLVLDTAGESFCWRPYARTVKNWNFPKFYGEKEMWVPVDHDLDDELQSFARCLRVSELVGLDCIEQYLPHRVAMQFGLDQDLPGRVARSNESPEIAWSNFSKPIIDAGLYVPFRLFEADVTTRYLEWWTRCVSVLQRAMKDGMQQQKGSMNFTKTPKKLKKKTNANALPKCKSTSKNSRGTKKCDFFKRSASASKRARETIVKGFKVVPKISKRVKKGDSITRMVTSTIASNEEGGCSKRFQRTPKSLPLIQVILKEMDNVSVPPGFPPKRNEGEARSSNEDNLTILEMPKSINNNGGVKNKKGGDGGNSSGRILSTSTADCEAARSMESETGLVGKGMHAKAEIGGADTGHAAMDARNSDEEDNLTILEILKSNRKHGSIKNGQGSNGEKPSGQSQTIPSSTAVNEAVENTDSGATLVDKVVQVQAVVGGSDIAMDHSTNDKAGSSVQSRACTNRSEGNGSSNAFEIQRLELELQISKLERLIPEIKAAIYAKNCSSSH